MAPKAARRRKAPIAKGSAAKKTRLACRARAKDGKRCKAAALPSGLCWRHDPKLERKRKAAEKHGGRRRAYGKAPAIDVKDLEGVRQTLCEALAEARALDVNNANLRLIIHACDSLREVILPGRLEERIAKLEADRAADLAARKGTT